MIDDPLSRPASVETLIQATAEGRLPPPILARAVDALRPSGAEWIRALDRLGLALGSALMLAGTIFFFAHNWDGLGRFQKLGLLQAGVAGTALLGWRLGPDRPAGAAALSSAAVLVGPLVGVYGQIYQTGAGDWELLAAWAGLTIPWVAGARSAPLALAWLVLANAALFLWWDQALAPPWRLRDLGFTAHAGLNGLAWIAWERAGAPRWGANCLALMTFTPPLPLAMVATAEPEPRPAEVVALAALVALVALSWTLLRRRDLFAMVCVAGSLSLLGLALASRVLFDWIGLEEWGLFWMSGTVIAEIALAAGWLRRLRREAGAT